VRLVLRTAAFWLMHGLRAAIPQTSPLAMAEFMTIRERLIKIGARVIERIARIRIHLPTSCAQPRGPDAAAAGAARRGAERRVALRRRRARQRANIAGPFMRESEQPRFVTAGPRDVAEWSMVSAPFKPSEIRVRHWLIPAYP
jgi:hypothetical protein